VGGVDQPGARHLVADRADRARLPERNRRRGQPPAGRAAGRDRHAVDHASALYPQGDLNPVQHRKVRIQGAAPAAIPAQGPRCTLEDNSAGKDRLDWVSIESDPIGLYRVPVTGLAEYQFAVG